MSTLFGSSDLLGDRRQKVPELHDHVGGDVAVVWRPEYLGIADDGDPVALLAFHSDVSDRLEQGQHLWPFDIGG